MGRSVGAGAGAGADFDAVVAMGVTMVELALGPK